MSFLSSFIRRFGRSEKGSLFVDAIVVMPMFGWSYLGMFVYWDAYRAVNTIQKASYSVSDLVSRNQSSNGIDDAYVAGMRTTFNRMLGGGDAGQIRLTSYTWSGVREQYEVIFSRAPGNTSMIPLTNATLNGLTEYLPIMADGDSAILLETRLQYVPPLGFILEPNLLEQFVVTRPRFLPKLCHVDFTC